MAKTTGKAGWPSKKHGHKSGTGRDNNIQRIVICVVVATMRAPSHVKNGMFNIKKENMASGP